MRTIKAIYLHCSDSDRPEHDSVEVIREWHTKRGFTGPDGVSGTKDDIGYHFFITRNGELNKGRDENKIGAHVKNHNKFTLGVCFSGRTFKDFHSEQFIAGRKLVLELIEKYKLTKKDVKLHRDSDSGKTCPNFSLKDFWQEDP